MYKWRAELFSEEMPASKGACGHSSDMALKMLDASRSGHLGSSGSST